MTLPIDDGALDAAVKAALLDDPAVLAAAPGGVHWGQAGEAAAVPHLIVSVASDVATHSLGTDGGLQTLSYLLRAVSYDDERQASLLLAKADAALRAYDFAAAVPAYDRIGIAREGAGQRYEDTDGFYNATAYYRLIAHKG